MVHGASLWQAYAISPTIESAAMSDVATHLRYREEVDGLRALAVVPVILFHAGFEWFSGGFVGVDVFFVISGYLITTIILSEKSSGRFSIAGFYERRARRILPALIFVILVCLPLAWMWMVPADLRSFSQSVLAVSVFASNILFWKSSGYFDASAEEKPLLHTWSLGVEEQYYLLFPLFIMLTWKLGQRRQAWFLVGIAAVSLALSEWAWRNQPMANFYLAPTRAWELLVGSLLAFASFSMPLYQRVGDRGAEILSSLGLVLIFGSIVHYDKTTPFPSLYALAPTLGTALILGFASGQTRVARMLSTKWVVVLGLISYSAYLWHQPLFAFARLSRADRPSPLLFLTLSMVAIGLAYLSWRYVEMPFRNRKKISRRPIFVLSAVGSLVLVLIGLAGELSKGFPGRLSESALALMETAIPSPKRDECHTMGNDFRDPAKACVYFNDKATWATFGDSHTIEPAYALAERLAARGQGLVHLSFSGCQPALLFESSEPGCTRWLNQALIRIELDDRIRNVLVGFRYSSHLYGDHAAIYPRVPDVPLRIKGGSPEHSRELVWTSFEIIIKRLRSAGKRVFVLAPIPELGRPVQQNILSGQFRGDASSDRGATRAYHDARNRFVLGKLNALNWDDNLVLVDPAAVLCDEKICRALIDSEAMYFDDDHLSVAGARRVVKQLDAFLNP